MVSNNYSEIEVTGEEFFNVINNSDKLVVVNFFAEWYMPCIMLFPVIEELANNMKDIKFVKINIDDNEEIAQKHNISTMPCIVIFKQGKEIHRIVGNHSIEIIEQKIKGCSNC